MLNTRLLFSLVLLNVGSGSILRAQPQSRSFLDLTYGGTALVGSEPFHGEYYKHNTNMLLLLSIGQQPDINRAFVASLELGFLGIPLEDDSCRLAPSGACTSSNYPFAGVIAATMGGRPIRSPWRFVELTAGPALIGQSGGGGRPLGAIAKARLGSPPGSYLSPGIALYGIAKVVEGGLLFGVGAGIGVRTW